MIGFVCSFFVICSVRFIIIFCSDVGVFGFSVFVVCGVGLLLFWVVFVLDLVFGLKVVVDGLVVVIMCLDNVFCLDCGVIFLVQVWVVLIVGFLLFKILVLFLLVVVICISVDCVCFWLIVMVFVWVCFLCFELVGYVVVVLVFCGMFVLDDILVLDVWSGWLIVFLVLVFVWLEDLLVVVVIFVIDCSKVVFGGIGCCLVVIVLMFIIFVLLFIFLFVLVCFRFCILLVVIVLMVVSWLKVVRNFDVEFWLGCFSDFVVNGVVRVGLKILRCILWI